MKLLPATVFGSHMVLQRKQPIHVWGKAAAGDAIYLTLGESSATAPVKDGVWHIQLPAREAATGLKMTITSQLTAEQIVFVDIAIGEVWLAGGQSNMEFCLRYDIEATDEIPNANDDLLRFFDYPEVVMPGQIEFGRTEEYGFWRKLTPVDAPYFSAVAYYFARKLRAALNVPVGILGCNYGGSSAAAWTAREELLAVSPLNKMLEDYEAQLVELDWQADEKIAIQRATEDPVFRRRAEDKILMGIFDDMEKMFAHPADDEEKRQAAPRFVTSPKSATAPCVLYEQMLKPLAPYGIRGVIWYQGESDNGPEAAFYDESMKAVRRSWSKLWGWDLPFFQVILAPFDHWGPMDSSPFGAVREMQMKLAADEPGFYCANIMDCGEEDNVHPREKRPAGERLALLVRRYIYGEDILADAPAAADIQWEEGKAIISFENAEGDLFIEGDTVSALELCVDGDVVAPQCSLQNNRLMISHDGMKEGHSVEIRFAQESFCLVNLYNAAHIPAFPFVAKHTYS